MVFHIPKYIYLWTFAFFCVYVGVGGGGWAGAGGGVAVRFLIVGTIGNEERPPRGQLWMEQYVISLKYWPI